MPDNEQDDSYAAYRRAQSSASSDDDSYEAYLRAKKAAEKGKTGLPSEPTPQSAPVSRPQNAIVPRSPQEVAASMATAPRMEEGGGSPTLRAMAQQLGAVGRGVAAVGRGVAYGTPTEEAIGRAFASGQVRDVGGAMVKRIVTHPEDIPILAYEGLKKSTGFVARGIEQAFGKDMYTSNIPETSLGSAVLGLLDYSMAPSIAGFGGKVLGGVRRAGVRMAANAAADARFPAAMARVQGEAATRKTVADALEEARAFKQKPTIEGTPDLTIPEYDPARLISGPGLPPSGPSLPRRRPMSPDARDAQLERTAIEAELKGRGGFTGTDVLAPMAGAGIGAAVGGTQGGTPEQRTVGAVVGGVAGAVGGLLGSRGINRAMIRKAGAAAPVAERARMSTSQMEDLLYREGRGPAPEEPWRAMVNGKLTDLGDIDNPLTWPDTYALARAQAKVAALRSGNRIGAVGDIRGGRGKNVPSLFAPDEPGLFGEAGTLGETSVGKRAPVAPEATGAAPELPGKINADEMAARRGELGAPKSEAEATAGIDQIGLSFDKPSAAFLASRAKLGEASKAQGVAQRAYVRGEIPASEYEAAKATTETASKAHEASTVAEDARIAALAPVARKPITGQGKLFDVGGAVGEALGTRLGGSAALATVGAALESSDNGQLSATGSGVMILAGLHAIGMPRIRQAGSFAGGKIVEGLKGSPAGERVLNFISHDILADPKVRSLVQAYSEAQAKGTARAMELANAAKKLGPERDRVISDIIEKERFEPLTPHDVVTMGVAQKISDAFTALGQAKVRAGLLSPETVASRQGSYLKRMFAEHLGDQASANIPTRSSTTSKIRIKGDRQRLDLSDEERNALGEMRESSFRTAMGIDQGYRDVAASDLFEALKAMPGVIEPEFAKAIDALKAAKRGGDADAITDARKAIADITREHKDGVGGFVKLADTRGMGVLRGALVRKDVATDLNGIPAFKGAAGDFFTTWKKIHTVLNPPTHVGNVMSNIAVSHMAGVPLWEMPKAIAGALKDYNAYGPATRYLAELGVLERGLPTATAATPIGGRSLKASLRDLAKTTRPETAGVLKAKGITPKSDLRIAAEKIGNRMEHAYAKEDGVFRVMVWKRLTKNGMSPEAAAKYVDEHFVNYTTRSPMLGAIKNTVSPFIMYPVRAIPHLLSQIIEHPVRWITLAASWGGMDQYSQRMVGAVAQEDLRPSQRTSKLFGYLVPGITQLPFTNKEGDKYVVDVARWTPFSALTGSPAPGSTAFAIGGDRVPGIVQPGGPLIDIGARLTNTDPYTGDKLIKPGDEAGDVLAAGARSAASIGLPSALSFHVPRVLNDLRNADPGAAALDATAFVGMRPRVIRKGVQGQNELRNYDAARADIIADLRRDLRQTKSPDRAQSLRDGTAAKLKRLADEYKSSHPSRR